MEDRFADDMVLAAENERDLGNMLINLSITLNM